MTTTTEVRERPILFADAMVRALLDGSKTQTRRLVKPQPEARPDGDGHWWRCNAARMMLGIEEEFGTTPGMAASFCPHGGIGDRLWVREAWSPDHAAFYPHFAYVYRADGCPSDREIEKGKVYSSEQKAWFPFRWRPSIHMPRWASRITLEITEVRVERLQSISEEDAIAEGIRSWQSGYPRSTGMPPVGYETLYGFGRDVGWVPTSSPTAKLAFARLWDSIHANPGTRWKDSPWVWVVEFRPIER